ncbi:MAG: hypothetical protein HY724_07285 [Candidatus Rokubacteria bacterium]|nr:hypothetical protein [Candidatus Rokubacteria bacterium]
MTALESVLTPRGVVLSEIPLQIDEDEVLRFQGYKKGIDHPTADVLDLFESALALGERLMVPRAVYRAVSVAGQGPDWIRVADGTLLHIPEIQRLWGSLAAVGAAICTVGEPIEVHVRELFDAHEFPLAVMLDSVGSAAAECLAEYVNDLLCQVAIREGQKVTNRVSPGYAGWDVAEQVRLFALCPGDPVGVKLNDHSVMAPGKSISFLVGVGPEARVDHYFSQCRRCWMRGCAYRRVAAERTVHRARR